MDTNKIILAIAFVAVVYFLTKKEEEGAPLMESAPVNTPKDAEDIAKDAADKATEAAKGIAGDVLSGLGGFFKHEIPAPPSDVKLTGSIAVPTKMGTVVVTQNKTRLEIGSRVPIKTLTTNGYGYFNVLKMFGDSPRLVTIPPKLAGGVLIVCPYAQKSAELSPTDVVQIVGVFGSSGYTIDIALVTDSDNSLVKRAVNAASSGIVSSNVNLPNYGRGVPVAGALGIRGGTAKGTVITVG